MSKGSSGTADEYATGMHRSGHASTLVPYASCNPAEVAIMGPRQTWCVGKEGRYEFGGTAGPCPGAYRALFLAPVAFALCFGPQTLRRTTLARDGAEETGAIRDGAALLRHRRLVAG